jgi:hypothetical protein
MWNANFVYTWNKVNDINIPLYILQRVEPLLCNDLEMGGYTRAVSGQRLSKQVLVARQQIINNATL